jgi:DNA polymerase-3 subunit beta
VKFRCEQDVLVEALAAAGRAATARASALPVLSGLRLSLADDVLRVTGSDLDLTITTEARVGGSEDGIAVLPAKLAHDIVRSLEPGSVEVDTTGERPAIRGGRSEFFLNAIPADEFPNLPEPVGETVTLAGGELAEGLRQVVRAASTDETRSVILTGVLLAAENGGMSMVSTDSYRLALRELPGTAALAEGQRMLVPSRALSELSRLLTDDTDVTLTVSERSVSFSVGNFHITTMLIPDEFPKYQKLIPDELPNTLTVARQAFQDAVRRVKLITKENTPLRLTMSEDGLELRAVDNERGEAVEQLDAKYDGEPLTVAFNPNYLMDGLDVTIGDEVQLQTQDAQRAAVLRSGETQDFLYLLMPVRVS